MLARLRTLTSSVCAPAETVLVAESSSRYAPVFYSHVGRDPLSLEAPVSNAAAQGQSARAWNKLYPSPKPIRQQRLKPLGFESLDHREGGDAQAPPTALLSSPETGSAARSSRLKASLSAADIIEEARAAPFARARDASRFVPAATPPLHLCVL